MFLVSAGQCEEFSVALCCTLFSSFLPLLSSKIIVVIVYRVKHIVSTVKLAVAW